jgi:hypothetical protein
MGESLNFGFPLAFEGSSDLGDQDLVFGDFGQPVTATTRA